MRNLAKCKLRLPDVLHFGKVGSALYVTNSGDWSGKAEASLAQTSSLPDQLLAAPLILQMWNLIMKMNILDKLLGGLPCLVIPCLK